MPLTVVRADEMRQLERLAFHEYKVTRQVSTGNGDTYLAQAETPPPAFVMGELGYGKNERPCTCCFKPCTLDFTLGNLHEINAGHLRHLHQRDPLDVPTRISSVDGSVHKSFGLGPEPETNHRGELVKQAKTPKKGKRAKLSAAEAQKQLRAQAKRAGIRVVKGGYVDDRQRTWTPGSTTRAQREATAADAFGRALASMCRRIRREIEREQKQQRSAA